MPKTTEEIYRIRDLDYSTMLLGTISKDDFEKKGLKRLYSKEEVKQIKQQTAEDIANECNERKHNIVTIRE